LAVRQRMPTAAVTWIIGPQQEGDKGYAEALHQRMLQLLREQRVTVLYESVASLTRDDVVLASGARLACDVPILVLAQTAPAWLIPSGLAVQDDAMSTDAFERSSSHPEVFHVWQDSEALANNVHAMMQSEPAKLRANEPRKLQFLYAGASHALLAWGGQCMQGRAVAWLKKLLKS